MEKKSFYNGSRRRFLSKLGSGSIFAGVFGGTSFTSVRDNDEILNKKSKNKLWDPFDFGAKGDGKTLDTKALQETINQCHKAGGGKVYLHSGCFISGSLYLKSNVSLYLEAGTILKGSDNLDDFESIPSKYTSWTSELVTHKKFIYAVDQKNISVYGKGIIDINGSQWLNIPRGNPSFSVKPRGLLFQGCENIHISGISLYNAPTWMLLLQSSKNIVIDGITIDSKTIGLSNQDGIDILDCQFVRISNCYINSGDDAIVMKSFSPNEGCANITITNCVVSSNTSGLKIGTETAGAFEDITISNCTVSDTKGEGISLISVDGARMERITVSNIIIRNLRRSSIFIRLGNRQRPYMRDAKLKKSLIRDIIIENIQGTEIAMDHGCIISGIPEMNIENLIIRNINLQFEGGGKAEDAERQVPELETEYPMERAFGLIPSYGFFIRHAKNVVLDEINLSFITEDSRPAIFCENVTLLQIRNLRAQCNSKTPALINIKNIRDSVISNCRPLNTIPAFIKLSGEDSNDIALISNYLKNARQSIILENEVLEPAIKEYWTIK